MVSDGEDRIVIANSLVGPTETDLSNALLFFNDLKVNESTG